MYTILALTALFSLPILGQSSSSAPLTPSLSSPSPSSSFSSSSSSLLSSPSSSASALTTSIIFFPNQPGSLYASIINVVGGDTTMGLSCPQATPAVRAPKRLLYRRQTPSSPSVSAAQCAMTDWGDQTIVVTEGTFGTATRTVEYTAPVGFVTTTQGVYQSLGGAVESHCDVVGTVSATCTISTDLPSVSVGPATTSAQVATTAGSTSPSSASGPQVTQIAPTAISMVPIVVTAGQEKLSSTSTTASANPSVSTSAKPSNSAGENKAGVGITGALMAGIVGLAIAI
ncbi:hypothetical protein EV356DRAFT_575613 [Viridothelium virens]|uniref:GPI anchored protein n=1 Tax=Viridothelium virens TaxID=1048519 RepID=A0A6A6HD55_VIRVR|nr:hypothetical protein EV356DRAFT_575613 [Viridothelium virens]